MERATKTIVKLRLSEDPEAKTELARRAWPSAVGKKIAAHTKAVGRVRNTLIVEVEDFIWQKQLFTLRAQIMSKLTKVIGTEVVTDVEFRIGIPRRMPQREERTAKPSASLWDEADDIRDPVLRRNYKAARYKAQA
jgi:predicted nucleic acid-binding Zn ribbon protein